MNPKLSPKNLGWCSEKPSVSIQLSTHYTYNYTKELTSAIGMASFSTSNLTTVIKITQYWYLEIIHTNESEILKKPVQIDHDYHETIGLSEYMFLSLYVVVEYFNNKLVMSIWASYMMIMDKMMWLHFIIMIVKKVCPIWTKLWSKEVGMEVNITKTVYPCLLR